MTVVETVDAVNRTDAEDMQEMHTDEATAALVESRESVPITEPVEQPPLDLKAPELYINRELSHLQFNLRVLEQALDESHPLLERLMFPADFLQQPG